MCTLIVLHRCVPGRPLIVAANRDEFLDRPAEGPALRASRTGPIVAPLDLEAGGTWLGLNAKGVFVGLTNLRPAATADEAPDKAGWDDSVESVARMGRLENVENVEGRERAETTSDRRSRGEVVMRALEFESATESIRAFSNLEVDVYNPFQLLIADGEEAWLLVYQGEPRVVQLEPGLHVIGNVVEDGKIGSIKTVDQATHSLTPTMPTAPTIPTIPETPTALGESAEEQNEAVLGASFKSGISEAEPRMRKLARIRERVEKMMTETDQDLFEGLADICREHVDSERLGHSPFESTCVHMEDRYGTRSSLLLELSTELDASRLWTTDGPPCEQPFENRSSLLRELGVRLSNWTETETT